MAQSVSDGLSDTLSAGSRRRDRVIGAVVLERALERVLVLELELELGGRSIRARVGLLWIILILSNVPSTRARASGKKNAASGAMARDGRWRRL